MNNSQARRPADVYLPAFAGSPIAFDFAITAPQRQETLAQASVRTAAAAEAYARHKELHLHTAQACEQQGIKFVPLVAECTGTWDPSALKILKYVAHAAAAKTGAEPAVCYNQLLQELGTTIRSFRARAALRRRFEASWAWHLHWHYSGHPSRSRSQPSKIEFGLIPPTWIPMAIISEFLLGVAVLCCFPNPAAPFASSVSIAAGVLLRLLARDRMCRRAIAVWLTLALFLAVWPDCRIFQWISLQFQLILVLLCFEFRKKKWIYYY